MYPEMGMNHFFHIPRTLLVGDKSISEEVLFADFKVVVVLAEPGGGKTSLLEHIARQKGVGVRYGPRQVSIGRTGFCVDILAPEFELTPENFVIHSHTNRADHLTPEDHTRSNGKSWRFTSVTVGKMPGRQVTIYDKRLEVTDKRKPIWWELWNANLNSEGLPPLDPKDRSESQIWRVEVRAGKRIMKDRWGITT